MPNCLWHEGSRYDRHIPYLTANGKSQRPGLCRSPSVSQIILKQIHRLGALFFASLTHGCKQFTSFLFLPWAIDISPRWGGQLPKGNLFESISRYPFRCINHKL